MEDRATHVTIHKAAANIGVADSVISRLVGEGRISHIRVGGKVRIPVAEIERVSQEIEDQRRGLSLFEASRRLSLAFATVRSAVESGELPSKPNVINYPGSRYIPREEFDRFCENFDAKEDEAS